MKLQDLTPGQLRILAALADCSAENLRHVISGRRGLSAQMAIRIEKAAKKLRPRVELRREDMNVGCASCEFARTCRKAT